MSLFRRKISPERIADHVVHITRDDYDQKIEALGGDMMPPIPLDTHEGFVSAGLRVAQTDKQLDGRVRSLRMGSLVAFESFKVPDVLTEDQIALLMRRQELAHTSIVKVRITEPDLERNSMMQFEGFFVRSNRSRLIASEGIARFLNIAEKRFLDYAEGELRVERTLDMIAEAYSQHIDTLLAEIHENG